MGGGRVWSARCQARWGGRVDELDQMERSDSLRRRADIRALHEVLPAVIGCCGCSSRLCTDYVQMAVTRGLPPCLHYPPPPPPPPPPPALFPRTLPPMSPNPLCTADLETAQNVCCLPPKDSNVPQSRQAVATSWTTRRAVGSSASLRPAFRHRTAADMSITGGVTVWCRTAAIDREILVVNTVPTPRPAPDL